MSGIGRVVIPRDAAGGAVELWSELAVVQDLPHLLYPDEVVKFAFTGNIARLLRPQSRRWLIVLTDQRVLCLKRSLTSAGPKVREVHYDSLLEVTTRSRILKATVVLTTSLGSLRIRTSRTDAHRIVQAINSLRRGQSVYVPPVPARAVTAAAAPESLPARRVSAERVEQLESNVEQLEAQVTRMQRQLEFFEQLLQTRAAAGELPPAALTPPDD